MKVGWASREPPLRPVAALARGEAARRLARRLRARGDEALAGREGVGGDGLLLVLGPVPWVDGLSWLGRDPSAPALLLPTTSRPDVPADLLQSAVLRLVPGGSAPLAVTADALVPAGGARPLSRPHLERWLAR